MSPRLKVNESPFRLSLIFPFHVIESLLAAVSCQFVQMHVLVGFACEVLARSRLGEWSELELHDSGARQSVLPSSTEYFVEPLTSQTDWRLDPTGGGVAYGL